MDAVDGGIGDVGARNFRRAFDDAFALQRALVKGDIFALAHVSLAIDGQSSVLEYNRGGLEWRRVQLMLGSDVADVVGAQRNVLEIKRTARVVIDVSSFTVANPESVDLEWVDALNCVLPSLLAQRY